MAKDIFSYLVSRFSADAHKEIREHERQKQLAKKRRQTVQRYYRIARYCLLAIALAGVVAAIRFAQDFGSMVGELSNRSTPDPSLCAPPKSNAKQLRKLAESRQKRDEDLDEIMK